MTADKITVGTAHRGAERFPYLFTLGGKHAEAGLPMYEHRVKRQPYFNLGMRAAYEEGYNLSLGIQQFVDRAQSAEE